MNHRLSATAVSATKSQGRAQGQHHHARQASTIAGEAETPAIIAQGDLYHFDPAAWAELVEQQRMRIARAAGVDPSKVTIRLGH